ncbi:hypothetical protein CHARACLAT_022879 [Characodon lateralis]|uniref:Uncharacterized protein n=1 Tax=Characodon lateralis TaxID=208331 RepID=A0ABU7EM45_9TELE|nr:hypothetical protein [Characodon lateralis]
MVNNGDHRGQNKETVSPKQLVIDVKSRQHIMFGSHIVEKSDVWTGGINNMPSSWLPGTPEWLTPVIEQGWLGSVGSVSPILSPSSSLLTVKRFVHTSSSPTLYGTGSPGQQTSLPLDTEPKAFPG